MTEFEDFYIKWYSRSICFAREYVLSEADAENIVQDVFLHLYERRNMFGLTANITAYLFTSIKNKCLDYLRKKVLEREAISSMQDEFDLALKMRYDSLEIFNTEFPDGSAIEKRLNLALQTLPECCRKIFIMNKYDGKTQRQIAEELHISVNTIESQMAIAYKKLRKELKDYMPLLIYLFAFI